MPHKILELQNGPKFKVSKDSFLQLKTMLSSTEVTEDVDIQALKSIDPMLSDDQVNDIFASFISNSKKAGVFFTMLPRCKNTPQSVKIYTLLCKNVHL